MPYSDSRALVVGLFNRMFSGEGLDRAEGLTLALNHLMELTPLLQALSECGLARRLRMFEAIGFSAAEIWYFKSIRALSRIVVDSRSRVSRIKI